MKRFLRAVRAFIRQHQFATAIAVVIAITGVMTSISMYLYIQSGASGLDLSRPGFTITRDDLQRDGNPTFPSTGSLSQEDMETFTKLYEEQRKYIQSLGSFDDDVLSDEALGFQTDAAVVDPTVEAE